MYDAYEAFLNKRGQLTKAQSVLKMWMNQNYKNATIIFKEASTADIVDKTGNIIMTITCNIFCDIMKLDDDGRWQKYAISDLTHDICHVGDELPTAWTAAE